MRAHVARHLLIAAGRGDSSGSDDRHACYAGITRGLDQSPAPRLSSRNPGPGGVAERLKAAVLKTAGPKGLAGSNPASSAFLVAAAAHRWSCARGNGAGLLPRELHPDSKHSISGHRCPRCHEQQDLHCISCGEGSVSSNDAPSSLTGAIPTTSIEVVAMAMPSSWKTLNRRREIRSFTSRTARGRERNRIDISIQLSVSRR